MRKYQIACERGKFYFRLRRPKPKVIGSSISWWEGWRGPYNSAREAKRQAILSLEKRDTSPGYWWKCSIVPALWS